MRSPNIHNLTSVSQLHCRFQYEVPASRAQEGKRSHHRGNETATSRTPEQAEGLQLISPPSASKRRAQAKEPVSNSPAGIQQGTGGASATPTRCKGPRPGTRGATAPIDTGGAPDVGSAAGQVTPPGEQKNSPGTSRLISPGGSDIQQTHPPRAPARDRR